MEETKPRVKSRRTKIVEALVLLLVLMIGVAIFFPSRCGSRENARRSSCQWNLKQIMLSVRQYVQDYDERYPLVATSKPSFGWADAIQPYVKSTQIFQCPNEKTASDSDPSQLQYTDYWFNARMAGKSEGQLHDSGQTISLGDGDSNNARYHLLSIPAKWRQDEKSPLYRHLDGANFAFADGHVRWFKADKWKDGLDFKGRGGPSFRLKPLK